MQYYSLGQVAKLHQKRRASITQLNKVARQEKPGATINDTWLSDTARTSGKEVSNPWQKGKFNRKEVAISKRPCLSQTVKT